MLIGYEETIPRIWKNEYGQTVCVYTSCMLLPTIQKYLAYFSHLEPEQTTGEKLIRALVESENWY